MKGYIMQNNINMLLKDYSSDKLSIDEISSKLIKLFEEKEKLTKKLENQLKDNKLVFTQIRSILNNTDRLDNEVSKKEILYILEQELKNFE